MCKKIWPEPIVAVDPNFHCFSASEIDAIPKKEIGEKIPDLVHFQSMDGCFYSVKMWFSILPKDGETARLSQF